MGFEILQILLLAVGLSMDSLAVSVTGGSVIAHCTPRNVMKIATVMGIFQAGMTIIGYFAGLSFAAYITAYDHWIAFFLLLYLGGNMIYGQFKEEEDGPKTNPLNNKVLCGLAIATSIDVLAVGISLALLQSSIGLQACIIGVVTFAFSGLGVYIGNKFGSKLNLKLDLTGGLILIAIGCKILIEHTLLGG